MGKIRAELLLLTGVSFAAVLMAAPASAQAQAGDASLSAALEGNDIVVTARRRDESLQDVPIAVTAISGEQLALSGADDISALSQATPSLTLENSRATNSTLTAFIRGVGQQDPVAGFEQGVGIYLDDVYLNRPQAALLDIYDVERIEVLRGPQGTLYGRNSIGGAVKYVTRRINPDRATVQARIAYGSYNQMDATATVSAPVSDTFRIGGTIATLNRDGFGTILTTGKDNYNKQVFGARAAMEWEPAETLLVRLSGDYTHDASLPRQGYRLMPTVSTAQRYLLGGKFDSNAGVAKLGPVPDNDVKAGGAALSIEWRAADDWKLRSITAWRKDNSWSPVDVDSTMSKAFDIAIRYRNRQVSQELQLVYEGDRLSGVFGAFYLDANAFTAFDSVFTSATQFTMGDVDTKAWAVFGEVVAKLGDTLDLTVGARYTSDKRSSTVEREFFLGDASPYFGGTGMSLTKPIIVDGREVAPTFHGVRKDKAFTPRAILAWKPSEQLNLYASYSRGFKGGGFDPRGNFANADVRAGFKPEFVDSYEVGAKSSLWDGRVTANTAFFYADYKDIQIPGSVIDLGPPVSFVGTVTNAGKARIWGWEFEGSARLVGGLRANASAAYNNARYTKFMVGGVNVARDRDIQNTPEWTGSGSLSYTADLAEGSVTFLGSASYRGSTQQFEFPIPLLDQPSYWLFDASVRWSSPGDHVRLGVYGRNLANKRYITSGYNFPGAATDNSVTAYYGNPRTVTVAAEYRF